MRPSRFQKAAVTYSRLGGAALIAFLFIQSGSPNPQRAAKGAAWADSVTSTAAASSSAKPTVTIAYPLRNTEVNGAKCPVVISYVGGNAGINRLDLLIDGLVRYTENINPPETANTKTYQFDTTQFSDAPHTISTKIYDAAGNTAQATVDVYVSNTSSDTTPPSVTIVNPKPDHPLSGKVSVDILARDNVAVKWVILFVDGTLKLMKNNAPFNWIWDTLATGKGKDGAVVPLYPNGPHQLMAKALDPSSNEGVSPVVPVVVYNPENDPNSNKTPLQPFSLPSNPFTPAQSAAPKAAQTPSGSATANPAVVPSAIAPTGQAGSSPSGKPEQTSALGPTSPKVSASVSTGLPDLQETPLPLEPPKRDMSGIVKLGVPSQFLRGADLGARAATISRKSVLQSQNTSAKIQGNQQITKSEPAVGNIMAAMPTVSSMTPSFSSGVSAPSIIAPTLQMSAIGPTSIPTTLQQGPRPEIQQTDVAGMRLPVGLPVSLAKAFNATAGIGGIRAKGDLRLGQPEVRLRWQSRIPGSPPLLSVAPRGVLATMDQIPADLVAEAGVNAPTWSSPVVSMPPVAQRGTTNSMNPARVAVNRRRDNRVARAPQPPTPSLSVSKATQGMKIAEATDESKASRGALSPGAPMTTAPNDAPKRISISARTVVLSTVQRASPLVQWSANLLSETAQATRSALESLVDSGRVFARVSEPDRELRKPSSLQKSSVPAVRSKPNLSRAPQERAVGKAERRRAATGPGEDNRVTQSQAPVVAKLTVQVPRATMLLAKADTQVRSENLPRPVPPIVSMPDRYVTLVMAEGNGGHKKSLQVGVRRKYLVRKGDTLASISKEYGVTLRALMAANGLRSSRRIQPGKELIIPRGPIIVYFDSKPLQLTLHPSVLSGIALGPFRPIFEHAGGTVDWIAKGKQVTAQTDSRKIKLQIGSDVAFVNESEVKLDIAAALRAGRTIVPLKFFRVALGAEVNWDPVTGSIEIRSK